MNEVTITDTVLKVAEKVAAIDLEQVEKRVKDYTRTLDLRNPAVKLVNAINPNCRERVERRVQATLDIAYLLSNLGGCFEKQEKHFEKMAAFLGRKPSDVSPDAVGFNAKLAYLRNRITEDELLVEFINGVRADCESFGGMLVPSRRAFALWIALGLSDGEMPALYRKALMLLRGEFKHSALLYGALGGLPIYSLAAGVGGAGMGIFCAIMGGLKGLKHKRTIDQYCPLISDDFLSQAEVLIRKIDELEKQLAAVSDSTEKTQIQQEYDTASQQLQELIDPPSSNDEEAEDENEDEDEE